VTLCFVINVTGILKKKTRKTCHTTPPPNYLQKIVMVLQQQFWLDNGLLSYFGVSPKCVKFN
jgi:hypothetical protein